MYIDAREKDSFIYITLSIQESPTSIIVET